MENEERKEIISYILKGNEMMKRHAEERQEILKKISGLIESDEARRKNLVDYAILEVQEIQNQMLDLELNITDPNDKDAFIYHKLHNLNKIIAELDEQEQHRKSLVQKVMQLDANLEARVELQSILQEYIDMETAQNHALVNEIYEVNTLIEGYQNKLQTYDKLSKHDPRFKALEILGNHSEGMSITQLQFMLEVSRYEGAKIIKELMEMKLITRVKDSELLRLTDDFDSSLFTPVQSPNPPSKIKVAH